MQKKNDLNAKSLSNIIKDVLWKAIDDEKGFLLKGFNDKASTVKQYVSIYKYAYPCDFEVVENQNGILIKPKVNAVKTDWIEKITHLQHLEALIIPKDELGCSERYFMTKLRALQLSGVEVKAFTQSAQSRLIVLKIFDDTPDDITSTEYEEYIEDNHSDELDF